MKRIVIINYGSGNLQSVYNALKNVSLKNEVVIVSSLLSDIKKATHLILPGVGSFKSCLEGLRKTSLMKALEEMVIEKKKPFLGICVGMQMLATKGYENGEFAGLNWIQGEVKKIKVGKKKLKIPHMGWNDLTFKRKSEFTDNLLKKIDTKTNEKISAYFVHSYNFKIKNERERVLTTSHGEEITAMVSKNNIIGTQFHPEKSHNFGLAFLKTFIEQEK
ncbi:MAG: imidazole glycerol phosphate synthase subunit HisH [Alphaproteobacteria bacterium]